MEPKSDTSAATLVLLVAKVGTVDQNAYLSIISNISVPLASSLFYRSYKIGNEALMRGNEA